MLQSENRKIILRLVKKDGQKYVEAWHHRKYRLGRVRVDTSQDGEPKASTVKSLRWMIEGKPFRYSGGNAHFLRLSHDDDEFAKALASALQTGKASMTARTIALKVSYEERRLADLLKRKGLKVLTNVYLEGYDVDILLPECRVVVEVEGLIHFREDVSAKDKRKLEVIKLKGYEVFRIPAREIRRNPPSVVDMVKDACIRRRHFSQKLLIDLF